MALTLITAGHCYVHGTNTPIENVVITVKNKRTNETHNGTESKFPELKTNSNGEFLVNHANFTNEYQDDDEIEYTLIYNGLKDLILYTISGTSGTTGLVMTPLPTKAYTFERKLDDMGSRITIKHSSLKSFDDDYDSVTDSELTNHSLTQHIYGSIQPEEDEIMMADEGVVDKGLSKGFFKVRDGINRGDQITAPLGSDNVWIIQDKPIQRDMENQGHHIVCRLRRIRS